MKFFTIALSLLPLAFSLPTELVERQSCAATCGNVCYYQSTLDKAVSAGYSYFEQGDTAGSSSYPHTYNNYEGFDFSSSGPYQEFPVLSSFKTYSGGSPGPDRVIFRNADGALVGVLTHTGASGNNFVSCD